MNEMSKRTGIESSQTIASVTVLSDHNCETRHIKSITGHNSDQAVESYNELPSMEQQQNMTLVVSDFIGNASSGSATYLFIYLFIYFCAQDSQYYNTLYCNENISILSTAFNFVAIRCRW